MAISFFALLDDVATLLDDISLMVKVATKKTAGVLGDDLALNANQLTEISAARELPVIWEVTKGSLVNKAIIVPIALLLSAFLPAAVPILLMIGGAYLCFEGVEKVLHSAIFRRFCRLFCTSAPLAGAEEEIHTNNEQNKKNQQNQSDKLNARPLPEKDLAALQEKMTAEMRLFEEEKIKAAVRTDFILSAEIIVIALGSFVGKPLLTQIIGLVIVAIILTVAVYGIVAIIVKMDDVGLYWSVKKTGLLQKSGHGLLWLAPRLLKALAYIGTVAMFVVGGHLWVENFGALHHFEETLLAGTSGAAGVVLSNAFAIAVGTIIGLVLFVIVTIGQKCARVA